MSEAEKSETLEEEPEGDIELTLVRPKGRDKKALWEAAGRMYEAMTGKKAQSYEEAFPEEAEEDTDDAET